MPRSSRIHVRGLKETSQAFRAIDSKLDSELRDGLKEAAEPVKSTATQLALSEIRNMSSSPAWAEQRIGVARRTALVFMVPRKRGSRVKSRKRKNFADLMSSRAMDPALEQNEERVRRKVEDVLDDLSRKQGF